MMINMIDEETTKRTDKVPEEEEDAYPKKTTFRHRIRDLIPFPWKRRRRKYKRECSDVDDEENFSFSSVSRQSPSPMMITITEDGEAVIQRHEATRSSLRRRRRKAGIGRWEPNFPRPYLWSLGIGLALCYHFVDHRSAKSYGNLEMTYAQNNKQNKFLKINWEVISWLP